MLSSPVGGVLCRAGKITNAILSVLEDGVEEAQGCSGQIGSAEILAVKLYQALAKHTENMLKQFYNPAKFGWI